MTDQDSESEPFIDRATDWLNDKLRPYIGPPPLGPYGPESTEPESAKPCPVCGHPINEHRVEVDPDTGHTYLHHPDAEFPGTLQVD